MSKIAIIGGSGFENPSFFQEIEKKTVNTPFGKPSSNLRIGKIKEKEVVILSRHDEEHTIPPTQVNNRANIFALKEIGCTHIVATTACGSLREEIKRGDLIILDQFIDFTKHRKTTFFDTFEKGNLKHTPMADPFSENLRNILIKSAKKIDLSYHPKGTVVTIEGPRFSTRAESNMFRLWGADVINMSTAPEAILAKEIGMPYAAIAMSTDYDCWKTDEKPVQWEEVIKVFKKNVNNVINLIRESIQLI